MDTRFDKMTVTQLKNEQKKRGISDSDIKGQGKNGSILKFDRVVALDKYEKNAPSNVKKVLGTTKKKSPSKKTTKGKTTKEKTSKRKIAPKETAAKTVYVLIEYNNDDNYDAYVIDVFSSAKEAKKGLMSRIEEDFNHCGGECETTESSDDSSGSDPEEFIERNARKTKDSQTPGFDKKNWEHAKPIILEELDKYKTGYWEYENKYSYTNYKVCKKTIK